MLESLMAIAALFALIFMRLPIAFAMIFIGTVGFALLRNWSAAFSMLGDVALNTGLSFTLAVIPLFILMGNFLTVSGVSQSLFAVAHRALAKLPGGLAMASIVACGGFSAVCGSSLATAATMSKVAMPSMKKAGYADSLATGSIAAGGTLGILIPPSVILIIYGLITEADIGDLFIAGIIPGLVGVLLYILAVQCAVWIKPSLAPKIDPEALKKQRLNRRDFAGVMAVICLFAIIMTGIYGGFFTPGEAAGIGAFISLIIAMLMGGMTWKKMINACVESATTTAMIFAIIIGAEVFSNFISFAGLPEALREWVLSFEVNAYVVIALIILIYIVLGSILESLSMILLTVPIFYPLVLDLDFGHALLSDLDAKLIWFGIIVVVVTEISLISPPVGLNVFVLRSVLPEIPLKTMFVGIFPFWVSDLIRLAILIAFPALTLMLIT